MGQSNNTYVAGSNSRDGVLTDVSHNGCDKLSEHSIAESAYEPHYAPELVRLSREGGIDASSLTDTQIMEALYQMR